MPAGRSSGIGAAVTVTAVTLWTAVALASDPGFQVRLLAGAAPSSVLWPAVLACAAIVGAAWVVRAECPHACAGLAAMTAGALLPLSAGWRSLPGYAVASLLAAGPIMISGTAQVGLWRHEPRDRRDAALVGAHTFVALAVGVLALAHNPFTDAGCVVVCTDVGSTLVDVPSGVVIAVVSASSIAAGLLSTRIVWSRRSRPPRPVLVAVLLALVVQVLAWTARWSIWDVPTGQRALHLVFPATAAVVAVVAATEVGRTMRTRAAVHGVVAQLSDPDLDGGRLGGIRAVHFALPDGTRWIDRDGEPVVAPAGRRHREVVVSDDDGPVLRLVLDRGTEADALAALTPASLLALRNAQLSAVARSRAADVRASRRRIVTASDAERRRIERDLHDGAQQRLVSVALHLRLAAADAVARDGAALDRAHDHVREALAQLRRIAHGVMATTAPGGDDLANALRDLVAVSEVPTVLEIDLDTTPVTQEVASAVLHVAAAALDLARRDPSRELHMSVAAGTTLTMRTVLPGTLSLVDDDLVDATDRVGALDGTISVEPTGTGDVVVLVVMPCES